MSSPSSTSPRIPPVSPSYDGGYLERQQSVASCSRFSSGAFSASSSFGETLYTPPHHPFLPLQPVPTHESRKATVAKESNFESASTGAEPSPVGESDCSGGAPAFGITNQVTRKLSISPSIGASSIASGTPSNAKSDKTDKGERAKLDQPHAEHRLEADKGNFLEGCPVCDRMAEAWRRRREKVERGAAKARSAGKPSKSSSKSQGSPSIKGDRESRSSLDTTDLSRTTSISRTLTGTSGVCVVATASAPDMPPLPQFATLSGTGQPHSAHVDDANRGIYHPSCMACQRLAESHSPDLSSVASAKKKTFGWGRIKKRPAVVEGTY